MGLRWSGSFAIALVLGCTGSNPAFDPGTGSAGATVSDDDGGSSTELPGTGDPSSEDSGADDAIEDTGVSETSATSETTDTDPTGGTCSQAAPIKVGTATSLDATQCPSDGFIRGHLSEVSVDGFSITDCGDCSLCPRQAPTWRVTIPETRLPEELAAGDCTDVFYDCDDPEITELRNVVIKQGPSAPLLMIAAPSLPETLGGWAPTVEDGGPCPTAQCPNNPQMHLGFVDATLGESENGDRQIPIEDGTVELNVTAVNAHYDPDACEPVVIWVGRK